MTAKRGDLAIVHTVSRIAVNGGADYETHRYALHVVTSITRDGAVKAVRELHRPDSTPQPVARMARHTMVTVPAAVCDLAALAQHVRTVRERTADPGYTYIPDHDTPVELLRDLAPHVSDPSAIDAVRAAAHRAVRESLDFVRADCARCGVRMGDGAGTVATDSDGCPVAVCVTCPHGVNFTTAYPVGLEVTVTSGYAQHLTTRIDRVIDYVIDGYYAGRSYVVTLPGYGARTLTEEVFAPVHVPADRYAVRRETSQPVEAQPETTADGGAGASSQPETGDASDYDMEAAQRAHKLRERARKAVTGRKYSGKPGALWHLSEVDWPRYNGTYGKAAIYATDDGRAYSVHTYAYHDGSELARITVKTLDVAFTNGERMADTAPAPAPAAPVPAAPVEAPADGGEVDMPALTARLARMGFMLAPDGTVTDSGALVEERGGDSRGVLSHADHADLLTTLGDRQGAAMMRAAGALEMPEIDEKTKEPRPRTAAQTAQLRKAIPAGVRGPAIPAIGDRAPAVRGAGTVEIVPVETVPAIGATVEVGGRRGRVLRRENAAAVEVWRGAKPGDGRAAVFFPADGGASLPAPVTSQRVHVSQPVETSQPETTAGASSQPETSRETTAQPVAVAHAAPGDTVTCPAPACGRRVRVTRTRSYPSHRAAGNDCAMSGQSIDTPPPAPRAAFSRPVPAPAAPVAETTAAPTDGGELAQPETSRETSQPDGAPVEASAPLTGPTVTVCGVEVPRAVSNDGNALEAPAPVPVPDRIGPGVWVVTGGGEVTPVARSGKYAGAPGHWVETTGAPRFAPEHTVRMAVIADTVCPRPRFACYCGRVHTTPDILAALPIAPAAIDAQPETTAAPVETTAGAAAPVSTVETSRELAQPVAVRAADGGDLAQPAPVEAPALKAWEIHSRGVRCTCTQPQCVAWREAHKRGAAAQRDTAAAQPDGAPADGATVETTADGGDGAQPVETAQPVATVEEPGVTYEAAWAPAGGTVTVVRNVRAGICGPFGDYPADSREAAAAVLAADGYAVTGDWSVSALGEHYAPLARLARPVVAVADPAPYWAPGYGPADGGETSQPVAGAAAPETSRELAPAQPVETTADAQPVEAPVAQPDTAPETSQPVEWLTPAQTAQLVREALREAFPAVRFGVRCSRGSLIRVHWDNGPEEREVRAVADRFRGADFDAMQDMTVYRDAVTLPDGRRVKFGARFITTHRTYTEVEAVETTAAPAGAAAPVEAPRELVQPVEITHRCPGCTEVISAQYARCVDCERAPGWHTGREVAQPETTAPAVREVTAAPVEAQPVAAAPAPVADSRDYPHAAILRELTGRDLAGRVKVTARGGAWSYRAQLRDGGEVTGRAVWSDESGAWIVCEVVPTVPVPAAPVEAAPAQPVAPVEAPAVRELAQPVARPHTVPDTAAAVVDRWEADRMPAPVSAAPAPAPVRPVVPSRVAAALARVGAQPAPRVARPVAQPVAVPAPVAPQPVPAPVAAAPVAAAPGDRGRYAYAPGTRVRATLREVRRELTAAQRAPETAPALAGVTFTVEADRPTVARPTGYVVVTVEAPAGADLAPVWAVVDRVAARHVPGPVAAV